MEFSSPRQRAIYFVHDLKQRSPMTWRSTDQALFLVSKLGLSQNRVPQKLMLFFQVSQKQKTILVRIMEKIPLFVPHLADARLF